MRVDTQEYLDMAMAALAEGCGSVSVPVSGTSMGPFLHPGDTVELCLPTRRLKTGDVVLYTRPGGRYILHRIVKCLPDGSYGLLGDNQRAPEPVSPEQIRAVVTAATRRGARVVPGSPVWWFYAHPWRLLAPLRPKIAAIHKRIRK